MKTHLVMAFTAVALMALSRSSASHAAVIPIANGDFETPDVTNTNADDVTAWTEENPTREYITDDTIGRWAPSGMTQVGYFTSLGVAINQDVPYNWASDDVYTLDIDVIQPGYRVPQSGDAAGVQLRQTDGTVLWDSGPISADGTLSGTENAFVFTGSPDRHHTFTIDAADFTTGTEGSPLNVRVYRDSGVVWFDNVALEANLQSNSVPEPSTMTLAGAGLIAVLVTLRRRRPGRK